MRQQQQPYYYLTSKVLVTHLIRKALVFAQCLLLCPLLNYAQAPDLKFEKFRDNRGLSQNSIMKVIQDHDGYLWIGTASGLYRYDGQRFTLYKHIIDEPNSLVNNAVYELELDTQGNILIGTGRGMGKYDKLTETFHTFPKILSDKRITSICPTEDGSIWVGTLHSGLYYFEKTDTDGTEPEHFFFNPQQANSLDDNRIHSIVQDGEGNIWVATPKSLHKAFRTGTKSIGFIRFNQFNQPKSLFVDRDKNLWIGMAGRRLVRLKEPAKFRQATADNFREYKLKALAPDGPHFGGIIAMAQGKDDNIWIGIHGSGLYWLNPETGEYKMYAPDPYQREGLSSGNIESILIDKTNVLWVGTEVGGLNKCDLSKKDILFYYKDVLSQNTLSNPSINAIVRGENDSTIWVGTQDGLNKIQFGGKDYKNPVFRHYYPNDDLARSELPVQQPVRSVLKDKDDDYWLGGVEGIVHMSYDSKTEKAVFQVVKKQMFEVFASLEDSKGNLWFGSFIGGGGLIKWKKKKKPGSNEFDFSEAVYYSTKDQIDHGLSGDEISCIYEDSKDQIWIGTLQGGLNLYIPGINGERDQFISYQHNPDNPNSISHNSIFSIHEDQNGDYWIGTFGGGLNKMIFPKTSTGEVTFKHYLEIDGLANDAVYGILEDKNGKLWLSTDSGISCFNPVTESFKNYTKEDGLQSDNYRKNAYLKNSDGYMLFGGLRGLNIFNPDNLVDNTIPAEVKLIGFKIKNEDVKVGKTYNNRVILDKAIAHMGVIQLKHHENTLTFEFAALHFAAPNKNKFRYQLVGFDEEWQADKGLPFAHYTNLPPGDYTFKVIASNNDDIWNEQAAEMNFYIHPPFWLTHWAYFIYALIILGIVLSIRAYYRLQSKERTALKVQKEMKEVNRLKLQFFTNISHEFKTPITLILTPLEEILESIKEDISFRPQLKVIERNANYLLRLVNQLMEFRKIEVGETKLVTAKANIINFVREVTFSFKALARSKNIDLSFESQLYTCDVWIDWDKFEKVLNNLIFNAIKFTAKGGQVVIRVTLPKGNPTLYIEERETHCEYIQVEVNDTGAGIPKEQLPYIFQRFYRVNKDKNTTNAGSGIGLAITKDLVDLHYGTIEVDSTEGIGTCFTVKIPVGNNHLQVDEILENSPPKILTEDELDAAFIIEEENLAAADTKAIHKISVLVVDDNKDIRDVVKKGLEKKYQIFEAENGREGLNTALREIPDLIVSDVLMPEMDGIEFCHQLKTNIRTSHIPVILLTALNSVEHRIEGLESGADAYIPKPFKMKLLGVRIDKLIETREALRKRFITETKITPEKVTLTSLDQSFLERAMQFMEKNMGDENYWTEELASDMKTSRSTFFRKLKKLTGHAPSDFMRIVRLKRAAQLLEQNQLTIAEIGYSVGFNDPGYFTKSFRKVYNQTPSQYVASKVKDNAT